MCGRYALYGPKSFSPAEKREAWEKYRQLIEKLIENYLRHVAPRYNIAPQQGNPKNFVPIVRQGADGQPELAVVQWWLLPHWSAEARIKHSTFNARIESVASRASFREPFKRRRCLIPASGWYEWQELAAGNLPWYNRPARGGHLLFAGLWERWQRQGELIESCSIIVGPADESVRPFHDRAPYTVDDRDIEAWLDPACQDAEAAMKLLKPFPPQALASHRVDKRVNKATIDDPALVEPLMEES